MPYLLALLGSVVTILVLLYRLADLGISLGGLNPFAWRRRRAWRRRYDANPIFSLDDPREIAGILAASVAKIDGDLSSEEKRSILTEFESTFSMSAKAASELLGSSVFLLGDMHVVSDRLETLLGRYRERFTPEQVESLFGMLDRIASVGGAPTPQQADLVREIKSCLQPQSAPQGTWG